MNTFIKTLSLAVALVLALFASQARAQDATTPQQGDSSDVSFQTFYDQLASQGSWINTDKYGYVFQPNETSPDWRPYTYGHWVNTDAGMTWVSDDSFGWATDHYGRWTNIDGYGWVWVPGYTWAPAWVSWREDDQDVGWAPLPPDSDQGIDYYSDDDYYTDPGYGGYHIGDDCDVVFGIGALWYNFCPVAFTGDRDCWRHFHNRGDNFAFIGRTHNVTNINFNRDGAGRFGHVHAEGPNVASLNTRSRTAIEHAQLASVSRANEAGLHGNRLGVFAPRVDPATFRTARPASVSNTLTDARVNHGTNINQPLAVNSRISPTGATPEQIHAASLARNNSDARIATGDTQASRRLTQPLGSMRTTTRSAAVAGENLRSNDQVTPNRVASPSVESRYTGQPTIPHGTMSSSAESRYTGEGFRSPAVNAPSAESNFRRSESGFAPQQNFEGHAPVFQSSSPAFQPQRSFERSAPAFQSGTPAFRPQQSFHSSAPAYHSQQSFHSYAPAVAPHFGGGEFSGGAPAQHFSGGGGGGHVSSGGGGGHAGGGGHR